MKTINIKHKILKWLSGKSSDILLKEYYKKLDGVLDFKFQDLIKAYIAKEKLLKKEFYIKANKHYKNFNKNKSHIIYEGNKKYVQISYETINEIQDTARILIFDKFGNVIYNRRFCKKNIEIYNL